MKFLKFTEGGGRNEHELFVNPELVTYLRRHQNQTTAIYFGADHLVVVNGDLPIVAAKLERDF